MPLDLDAITDQMIADHMMDGPSPITGVDIDESQLVGKSLSESPRGPCGLCKWIEANTGQQYTAYLTFGFGSDGARWKMVLKDRNTQEVVKVWGDKYVTGSPDQSSAFSATYEKLGHMLLIKLAQKISEQLGI